MGASFKVTVEGLRNLAARFDSPTLQSEFAQIASSGRVAGIISQAIADNFNQEGPGWKPLKVQTIRQSVSKALRRKLKKVTDTEVQRFEELARIQDHTEKEARQFSRLASKIHATKKGIKPSAFQPNRRILRRTSTLFRSVTTPGGQGNIYKTEGTRITWGTNLVYAGIHNKGGIIKHPGTKNGFGRGIKLPPHDIPIPKREFLVLRDEWKARLYAYVAKQVVEVVKKAIRGNK